MKRIARLAVATAAATAAFGALPALAGGFLPADPPAKPIPVLPGATPVGGGGANGVRPGSLVESPSGFCTLNFLFRSRDGHRYIGTAGHCVIGTGSFSADAGERSWRARKGPIAKDAGGATIGRFVYAVLQGERDFSLIRLKRGVAASAQMRHFGGPTGVYTDRSRRPVTLNHYGLGIGIGNVAPARTMTALNTRDPDEIFGQGVVVPGDSGGPVILARDGRAVGLTVTTGLHARPGDFGPVGITRIDPQRDRAAQVLRTELKLQRAPLR